MIIIPSLKWLVVGLACVLPGTEFPLGSDLAYTPSESWCSTFV